MLVLMLFCKGLCASDFAEGGYIGSGISREQRSELELLLHDVGVAVAVLPRGHAARDELSLLHDKLHRLSAVSSTVDVEEWDVMLTSLLGAHDYGADAIAQLLRHADDAGTRDLGDESLDACESSQGSTASQVSGTRRRLLQARDDAAATHSQHAVQQSRRAVGSKLQTATRDAVPAETADTLGAADWGEQAGVSEDAVFAPRSLRQHPEPLKQAGEAAPAVAGHWRWLLDRPPPWERDCDCCFTRCPAQRACIKQSETLYLACRGDSIGVILDRHWQDRPMSCTLLLVSITLGFALWIQLQVRNTLRLDAAIRRQRMKTAERCQQ